MKKLVKKATIFTKKVLFSITLLNSIDKHSILPFSSTSQINVYMEEKINLLYYPLYYPPHSPLLQSYH